MALLYTHPIAHHIITTNIQSGSNISKTFIYLEETSNLPCFGALWRGDVHVVTLRLHFIVLIHSTAAITNRKMKWDTRRHRWTRNVLWLIESPNCIFHIEVQITHSIVNFNSGRFTKFSIIRLCPPNKLRQTNWMIFTSGWDQDDTNPWIPPNLFHKIGRWQGWWGRISIRTISSYISSGWPFLLSTRSLAG